MAWMILNRDVEPMGSDELPQRPEDARDSNGDTFTPWFNPNAHLHIMTMEISGIHYQGTLEEAQELLNRCLAREAELFHEFGFHADIDIADVMPVLEALEQAEFLRQLQTIPNPAESWISANESFTVA